MRLTSNISFFLVIIIPNGRPGYRIGIATRCGPDGLDFELQCGRDFPDPFRLTLNTTGPHVQLVPGLFPGGKAAGAFRLITDTATPDPPLSACLASCEIDFASPHYAECSTLTFILIRL